MKTSNHKTMSATEQAFWNKVKQSIFSDRGCVALMFVAMIVGFLAELV